MHPATAEPPVIRVVAAVIVDARGFLLLVRKHGTEMFMQPGGKPEPGETAAAALARELQEEIGLVVALGDMLPLGRFRTQAANEPGHELDAEMFRVSYAGEPVVPAAEIVELGWFARDALTARNVAPLVQCALPYLR